MNQSVLTLCLMFICSIQNPIIMILIHIRKITVIMTIIEEIVIEITIETVTEIVTEITTEIVIEMTEESIKY